MKKTTKSILFRSFCNKYFFLVLFWCFAVIFVSQANGISNKKIEEEFLKYSIENFEMTPILIG